jgi:hypothetical protein
MAEPVTFGRRKALPSAPVPAQTPGRPELPSPDLEAFAASIRNAQGSDVEAFARWRREQAPRRLLMLLARFALLTPGLLCFALHAPWWVSTGLEAAGLAANAWLRRERRRQASAIAAWTPET